MKTKHLLFHTIAFITLLALMILTSCSETSYISRTGYVVEINKKSGYFVVNFPCENPRYRRQPCGAWLDFKLDSTVTLFQKFEVK
jgi:hypothetical protein